MATSRDSANIPQWQAAEPTVNITELQGVFKCEKKNALGLLRLSTEVTMLSAGSAV